MKKNSGKFNPKGAKEALARLNELKKYHVVAGIPLSANGEHKDGVSNAVIAAAHEFGATIKHPGGTAYGYKNEKDAKAGKSRFLKKGQGFMQTGSTGPHTIIIPERSHYRSTLAEKRAEYSANIGGQIKKVLAGTEQPEVIFEKLGMQYSNDVKRKIQSGITPALDPKTIKRKGSSKPLIDTGQYIQSITYEVRRD